MQKANSESLKSRKRTFRHVKMLVMYRACTIAACTKFKIEFCNCELFAYIKNAKKWKSNRVTTLAPYLAVYAKTGH